LSRELIKGGGATGCTPQTSEIYGFQEVFRFQRILSPPPWERKTILSPEQIPDYAPGEWRLWVRVGASLWT